MLCSKPMIFRKANLGLDKKLYVLVQFLSGSEFPNSNLLVICPAACVLLSRYFPGCQVNYNIRRTSGIFVLFCLSKFCSKTFAVKEQKIVPMVITGETGADN